MRRTIEFCNYQASWWDAHADLRLGVNAALMEGIHAYAIRQATTQRLRAAKFVQLRVNGSSSQAPLHPADETGSGNERADAEDTEYDTSGNDWALDRMDEEDGDM